METQYCIHHWYIVGRLGTCKKCGATKTFDDPTRAMSAAEYRARQRKAQEEVHDAKGPTR